MIIDSKWVLKTAGGSEDLATSGTTAVTSDYIDLASPGYMNAGRPMSVKFVVKATTAAAGTNFTFDILDCDTAGGTYVSVGSKTIARTDLVAASKWDMLVPFNTRRYIKFSITPGASMTGALTVNAAIVNQ